MGAEEVWLSGLLVPVQLRSFLGPPRTPEPRGLWPLLPSICPRDRWLSEACFGDPSSCGGGRRASRALSPAVSRLVAPAGGPHTALHTLLPLAGQAVLWSQKSGGGLGVSAAWKGLALQGSPHENKGPPLGSLKEATQVCPALSLVLLGTYRRVPQRGRGGLGTLAVGWGFFACREGPWASPLPSGRPGSLLAVPLGAGESFRNQI